MKDKLSYCTTISDTLCGSNFQQKSGSDFAKYLTLAMEFYFHLLEAPELEVSTRAEESLNKVIRGLSDTHVGRLQVEMYKEIKKNGPAKSLRAALLKFAHLSPLIRPQKCRAYLVNLLPSLVKIARRQEEVVHEALAATIPPVFAVLGPFTNDNEVRLLLKTYVVNLFDSNPLIRRTTAVCLTAISDQCRKPEFFVPWLLATLLDFLVPLNKESQETPTNRILGILLCARQLIPKLERIEQQPLPEMQALQTRLLQLYELCLHFIGHQDHNVVTHALETLQQLLKTPHQILREVLISPIGLDHSYIFDVNKERSETGSGANLSRLSSLVINEDEESLLDLEPSVAPSVSGTIRIMDQPGGDAQSVTASEDDQESNRSNLNPQEEVSLATSPIPPQLDEVRLSPEKESNPMVRASQSSFCLGHEDRSPLLESIDEGIIGSFTDTDIPLIFCARKLTLSFLLTTSKGEQTPKLQARTSVKVLALGCLTAVLRLAPKIFLLTLLCDQEEEDATTVLIRDVTGYSDHQDPQLRGFLALLLGTVVKGALVESGGDLPLWFNGRRPDHVDLLHKLCEACKDESSVSLRLVTTGVNYFIRPFLLSGSGIECIHFLGNPFTILSQTSYWLLKLELCDFICNLPFDAIHYTTGNSRIQNKCLSMVHYMLADEDHRVRAKASSALVDVLDKIYCLEDDPNNDPVIASVHQRCRALLYPIVSEPGKITLQSEYSELRHNMTKGERASVSQQAKITRLVENLSGKLNERATVYELSGCIEALAKLSDKYPPVVNAQAWGCIVPRIRKSSARLTERCISCPAMSLLELLSQMLTRNSISLDIITHGFLVKLITRLLSGLAMQRLKSGVATTAEWINSTQVQEQRKSSQVSNASSLQEDPLERHCHEIYLHCVKMMAIVTNALEDSPPNAGSSGKPALGSIGNPSLSPIKKKAEQLSAPLSLGDSGISKENQSKKLGCCHNSPHYIKLQEILKSLFNVHKISLEDKHYGKLKHIVGETLSCFSHILELTSHINVGKHTEEILGYLKAILRLEPLQTLAAVQTLLRSIFKTHLAATEVVNLTPTCDVITPTSPSSVSSGMSIVSSSQQKGLFHPCFDVPYNNLVHMFRLARDNNSISEMGRTDPSPFNVGLKKSSSRAALSKSGGKTSTERSSLSSFIRLFEPMVIRALKHYTLTSDVEQQSQVLRLLIQLVQLRVNYCLLDSDQIFISFVIKQLEYVEEGHLHGAHVLLPNIFRFLVLLSYEKNHSKPIIDTPKILRLCEGLFASGRNPEQLLLPALIPVAEDLFCHRSPQPKPSPRPGGDPSDDLESQREVALNMLLKLMVFPEALRTMVTILGALKAEGEEKWRKVSRTITDVIIPLLVNHKIYINNKQSLELLKSLLNALAPGCLRPVDPVLAALLTCSVDLSLMKEVQRWLGFVVIGLTTLTIQSPEEGILGRLEELGIQLGQQRAAVNVLLNTSMESSTSTNSTDPLGVVGLGDKPEVTLTKFIIHVIGSACSKLHQIVYSQPSCDGKDFLKEELSHLLLLVSYMFQSGRYLRVTRAAQTFAQNGDDEAIYSIEMINELFLQLAHDEPYLTLQWAYILNLLKYCPTPLWSRILAPNQKATRPDEVVISFDNVIGLNPEILRVGGLILYCDILCNNLANVECTTWLVVNYVKSIVKCMGESPVQDFVMALHRSSSSSGLLLQAIMSRCQSERNMTTLIRTLDTVENTHPAQNGKLFLYLVKNFILSPWVSLAKFAEQVIRKRVDQLLTETRGSIQEQLSHEEMSEILELMRTKQDVKQYYGLVKVLNELSHSFYNLSPIESEELRTFTSASVANVTLNRDWFLSQVRQKCCNPKFNGEVCSELMGSLTYEELSQVIGLKEFNLAILSHCFRMLTGRSALNQAPNLPSSVILDGARDALIQHLKELTNNLPQPFCLYRPELFWDPSATEVKYANRLEASFFLSEDQRLTLGHMLEAYAVFLDSGLLLTDNREITACLARFGILASEYVKWILAVNTDSLDAVEHQLNLALGAVAAAVKNEHLLHWYSSSELGTSYLTSAVLSTRMYFSLKLSLTSMNLFQSKSFEDQLEVVSNDNAIILACLQINEMFTFVLEHQSQFRSEAKNMVRCLEDLVLGLARMPVFTTYLRIPPKIWKFGWEVTPSGPEGTTFPILGIEFLQDIDLLAEYVRRINTLGWGTRQQFEGKKTPLNVLQLTLKLFYEWSF